LQTIFPGAFCAPATEELELLVAVVFGGGSVNWSDERYVRLYTRDTVTWRLWSWETRAVFSLLLRRADRSGVLDTGTTDKAQAMALILEIPTEVSARVLAALLDCGTMISTRTALVLPSFVDAQESRQSDRVRQAERRAKRALSAASIENHGTVCHTQSQTVTDGHTASQIVTPAVPCRAEPAVPNQPEKIAGSPSASPPQELNLAPSEPKPHRVKKPSPAETTRPQWADLIEALVVIFAEERDGGKYALTGRDLKSLGALYDALGPHEVVTRWRRALRHQGFPAVGSIVELGTHANHFAAVERPGFDPNQGIIR
jgi:hypothetical protein